MTQNLTGFFTNTVKHRYQGIDVFKASVTSRTKKRKTFTFFGIFFPAPPQGVGLMNSMVLF